MKKQKRPIILDSTASSVYDEDDLIDVAASFKLSKLVVAITILTIVSIIAIVALVVSKRKKEA